MIYEVLNDVLKKSCKEMNVRQRESLLYLLVFTNNDTFINIAFFQVLHKAKDDMTINEAKVKTKKQ